MLAREIPNEDPLQPAGYLTFDPVTTDVPCDHAPRIQPHMLSTEVRGTGTLLILLHWLGGSARTWTGISEHLVPLGFRCVAIDLPGFGFSTEQQDFSIPAMLRDLTATIRDLRAGDPTAPWLLAGHSMGGKLAMLLASAAQQQEDNLAGLVLFSPSTPSPEPMKESQREANLRNLGPATSDPDLRRQHAAQFVDDNTGNNPLPDPIGARSIDDVLRMNPDALTAWMTTGSKLDCSEQVGTLNLPALILAGTEEPELNPDAQQQLTLPHLPFAKLVPLIGSGHLSPLERPAEVSARIAAFFRDLGLPNHPPTTPLDTDFSNLIHSDLTSPQTREALLARIDDTPTNAGVLSSEELLTLQALTARIIPNAPPNLAARLNQSLAQPKHDGWRFDTLPTDATAWPLGLATLDAASTSDFGVPFLALHNTQQDDLLHRAQQGHLHKGLLASLHLNDDAQTFNAAQMQVWFEDVRGELTKLYVADPRTMQRIGFTGFADEAGFTNITIGANGEATH